MKCYNCGCDLSEKDFCTGCGVDVGLYKKIMHISNRYYNDGLAKANIRDLSGAITSLRQSLKFNKNNIEARNLLGLVYFEMGEVVAALSEWVISKNLRPKKNLADDYIEAIQSNPTRLDTINQTVKKYNLALRYCYQDSKDLAIIQLKKVLSLNPRLIQGHQLLALLYMDSEQWDKAKKELLKCCKIDANNTTTLSYLKQVRFMLEGGDESSGSVVKKRRQEPEGAVTYQSGNETIIQPLNVREGRASTSVLNIVIGLVIGLAVAYFLILPAKIQAERNEMKEELKIVSENSDAKSAQISELQQQVDELSTSKGELQNQIDEYTGANGESRKTDVLLQTATDYLQNPEDYTAIADTLYEVDLEYVNNSASDAYRQLYFKLMQLVGQETADMLYENGSVAINQSDYTTAIIDLEKAWYFSSGMEEPNPDILYELAQAYQLAGETDKAYRSYNQLVTDYPDTQAARKAEERVTEMEEEGVTGVASEGNQASEDDTMPEDGASTESVEEDLGNAEGETVE